MAPPTASPPRFTLADLRAARAAGRRVAMLTCYDYTSATHLVAAGVRMLLVGDSASSVILGHPTTLPVSLAFMVEITAAVRRGAPSAMVVADMPFGSYHTSDARGAANVFRMVRHSGCDAVKLEVGDGHLPLVRRLTDAGVAVIAHIGLRPQAVALDGYRTAGRTAASAATIVDLAIRCQSAGAAALLVEAVPAETGAAIVAAVDIPVIGCGAGPACCAHVVVTHDLLGLTPHRARFVPDGPDLSTPLRTAISAYVTAVESGAYPAAQHAYSMADGQHAPLNAR